MFTGKEESEVSFCQLGGIVLGNITKEDVPRVTYWTLRLQEAIFNISEYSSISFSHKQKRRRNIGIGLVNLQSMLVQEVYSKFPQKDWVKEAGRATHEWVECIQFNLIKASIELAKELGPCDLVDRVRYSRGILPIDHAKKTPLTDFEYKQDWESLRADLIKYGVRFGPLTAVMPAESSSIVFSTINGIEFPRAPATFKGNKKLSILVTVPNVEEYGSKYVYAWGDYSFDVNDLYLSIAANITKFIDQGISYNFYIDYNKFKDHKLPELYLIDLLLVKPAYAGIKTTYYANFNVDIKEPSSENSTEEMSEEEKQFYENLKQLEQESATQGCASGACSL